jgi:Tfp pilus assembly protein PilZ
MGVKTEGSDRRKTHRLDSRLEVNFSDGRSLFKEVILDLSTGGLQAEAPRQLDVGTELTLSIVANPPVKVKGVVRWTMKKGIKYRLGVQFSDLPAEQEVRIRELVQALFWETYDKVRRR